MTPNRRTIERYLEGFRANDHHQILSCLTDDVEWIVFGAFRVVGKEAYAAVIEGPGFTAPPELSVVRMVEEKDTVMAELTGEVPRQGGASARLTMAEVFVMRDNKIAERRAWVIELVENDHR